MRELAGETAFIGAGQPAMGARSRLSVEGYKSQSEIDASDVAAEGSLP
jgi:hypothetical protein